MTEGELQREAEKHLDHLFDSMDEQPEGSESSVTGAWFCGCTTCIVREILAIGWANFVHLEHTEVAQCHLVI